MSEDTKAKRQAAKAELHRDMAARPDTLLAALGLLASAKRQPGGWFVRCPWHADSDPSCSVQVRQGALVAHCFACNEGGDGFALIGQVRGLNHSTRRLELLREAAGLMGRHDVVRGLDGAKRGEDGVHAARVRPVPLGQHSLDLWPTCPQVERGLLFLCGLQSGGTAT